MPRIASGWSAAVQSAADRAGISASRWDRHTRIVRRLWPITSAIPFGSPKKKDCTMLTRSSSRFLSSWRKR
jgi:hypothetical protein